MLTIKSNPNLIIDDIDFEIPRRKISYICTFKTPQIFNNRKILSLHFNLGEITFDSNCPIYSLYKNKKLHITPRSIRQVTSKRDKLIISFPGLKKKLIDSIAKNGEIKVCTYKFKRVRLRADCINIKRRDYYQLNDKLYLNDIIINFYLKLLDDEFVNREYDCLILNSYIYTILVKEQNAGEIGTPLRLPSGKKTGDIFKYKNAIIPMNEQLHWFMVIVKNVDKMENIFLKQSEIEEKKEQIELPEIYYLDSLYFQNKKCVNIIKKYLFYEFKAKYPHKTPTSQLISIDDIIFTKEKYIKCYNPLIPKQPNSYDCGIYLLTYVEVFLGNMEYFFKRAVLNHNFNGQQEMNEMNGVFECIKKRDYPLAKWFTDDMIIGKRKRIQNLIDKLAIDQKKAVDEFLEKEKELLQKCCLD